MKLILTRDVLTPTFTLGKLQCGEYEFFTCEDAVREIEDEPVESWKIPGKTAIPKGKYRIIINFSQRFQRHLPLLLDVPGFKGIRLHPFNRAEESEGCIGPGMNRDKESGTVYGSRNAMNIIQPMLQSSLSIGDDVWIQIH